MVKQKDRRVWLIVKGVVLRGTIDTSRGPRHEPFKVWVKHGPAYVDTLLGRSTDAVYPSKVAALKALVRSAREKQRSAVRDASNAEKYNARQARDSQRSHAVTVRRAQTAAMRAEAALAKAVRRG